MRNDLTFIAEILDRSGSMLSIRPGTIDGHNEFLRGQRAAPGTANYWLVQFDHEFQTVYEGRIESAPELNDGTFVPRGSTALLDAIGRTIVTLGGRLAVLPEAERPAKVVVVIITDGAENASKEWTRDRIFELIRRQCEQYSWEFLFLGANQDAIQVGSSLGVGAQNAMTYLARSANAKGAYQNVSHKVANLRSAAMDFGASATLDDFTEQERKDALKDNA